MTLQSEAGPPRPGARRPRTNRGSETRRRVAVAAARLFTERGYDGTSMQAIADAAGVHAQTVYLAFGTKAAVLAEAAAFCVDGDVEPGGEPSDRGDPASQLCRFARRQTAVAARLGPLLALVVAAAYNDPEVAAFCEHHRGRDLALARSVVGALEAAGALRHGMSIEDAADVLYTLTSPGSYVQLVGERGWTPERHEQWLAELLCDRLLGSCPVPGKGRRRAEC
jgi:AcrR family transcriptional regulator